MVRKGGNATLLLWRGVPGWQETKEIEEKIFQKRMRQYKELLPFSAKTHTVSGFPLLLYFPLEARFGNSTLHAKVL